MSNNLRILIGCSFILTILFEATQGNVLLMSKDNIHLQQEQLSNIIRSVRSKVGQPSIVEVWEVPISDNGEYPSELNRIRRSIEEIHDKENKSVSKEEESRNSRSLDQQQSSIDVPVNDLQQPRFFNDRDQIHVVSSAIRVLSKKQNDNDGEQTRQKRNEYQWRRPRTQFVTRTERMSPLTPRYQFPPERSDRYLSDNEITPGYRRSSLPQRRIIYYATLPEIVRPPISNDWQHQQQQHQQLLQPQQHQQLIQPQQNLQQFTNPSRQQQPSLQQPLALESRPYYPIIRDNEVTRVQSSVIDVTNRDSPMSPSQTPTIISSVLPSPKYSIIDAEPPSYFRPYYNNYPYNVRYPQPYHNYNNNNNNNNNNGNRYYYDGDIRTPPYRIQQTFQPPYYSKPEYIPVESPTPSPTPDSAPSTPQQSITEINQQQISSTNSTNIAADKSDKNNSNSKLHNNSVNSRYV